MMESGKFAVWQAPGRAWTVEYQPALMEQVRRHVLEAFFAVPRVGAEAGGVLYGSREGARVRITAFRPLECEHRSGPSFTLSPADHARLAALMAAPGGLAVAGWYHSHTRGEVFLSPEDLELHARYFPEPWQVALVLRPGAMVTRAGFFVRGPDGALKADASPLEFVVQPMAEAIAPSAPAPEPAPELAPPPPEPPAPVRRRRRWPWLLAPLAIALGAAGFFMRGRWLPVPQPPVALVATDRDGRLEIHWNAEAPAIREAAAAKLEITDGAVLPAAMLAPAHLRGGRFAYMRQTGRVDVRLVLERGDGSRTAAGLTFLGVPPPHPGVEQELHRARTEMLNQAIQIRELQRTIDELKSHGQSPAR